VFAAARRALTNDGGGRRTRPLMGARGPPVKPLLACELEGVTGLGGSPCGKRVDVTGGVDALACERR
jgi:hypothetical protein